jgi:RHS repeat-associated protein
VTDTWRYTAFGEELTHTGAGLNPYRFAGERYVGEVGLYQNRARWLDTGRGAFVSADGYGAPAVAVDGDVTTPSRPFDYVYAGARPIGSIDPTGEMEFSILGLTITVNIQANARTIEGGIKGQGVSQAQRGLARAGLRSYDEMKRLQALGKLPTRGLNGEALEVHHIFERRILRYAGNGLKTVYKQAGEIPGVLLTRAEHQAFNAAWRQLIPYRNSSRFISPSLETIVEVAQEVYAGNPVALREALLSLL